MNKEFIINIQKNKRNGQFTCSLPKKDLPKTFIEDFDKLGKLNAKIKMEGWF